MLNIIVSKRIHYRNNLNLTQAYATLPAKTEIHQDRRDRGVTRISRIALFKMNY